MARNKELARLYRDAAYDLKSGRLNSACAFLSMHFARHAAHKQLEALNALQEDNERLLSYLAQGTDDPRRLSLRDELMNRAWTLIDELRILEEAGETEGQTNKAIAPSINLKEQLERLSLQPNDDELLGQTFEQIAGAYRLDENERKAVQMAILDEQLPEYVRATLLSAVALLITQWFDARLAEDLYIFTLDDQPVQLRAQAWVILVIVSIKHSHRIAHLPRLQEQYQLLAESEPQLLYDLQIALLQCREAVTADDKINELVSHTDEEEDYEQTHEKMQELFKLITDGVDLTFNTFDHLCHLSFFADHRHHWLMPFALEHSTIREVLDLHPKAKIWTQLLMQSVAQCETEKYSAFLSMYTANPKLMIKISEQLSKKGFNFDQVVPMRLIVVARNYLHDLFRYCYLHPQGKSMLFKPFEDELNLCLYPWLHSAFSDVATQRRIADYLFGKRRWTEASHAYLEILKHDESEETLQRLALSLINRNDEVYHLVPLPDYENGCPESTEILLRCNDLYPGNKWTEKHLADELETFRLYDTERLCLREALTHHPNDVGLLARMGRVLTLLGNPTEGLKFLFQADVLKEGQLIVHRGLALAYLELQDTANAERWARKVLSRPEPSLMDWLIASDIALASGNVMLCVERRFNAASHPRHYLLSETEECDRLQRRGIDLRLAQLANEMMDKRKDQQDNN